MNFVKCKLSTLIRLNIVFLLFFQLTTGCATTPEPEIVTCADINQISVVDFTKRLETKGFSVLPPSGKTWCEPRKQPKYGVIFSSFKFIGKNVEKAPSVEEMAHSYIAFAYAINVEDFDISSSAAVKDFVKRWYIEGKNCFITKGEGIYATLIPTEGCKRFNLIELKLEFDSRNDADCVRYVSRTEENKNPRFPSFVLELNEDGLICRHPQSMELLIMVSFSERYRKGYEYPELTIRLKKDADQTIHSLKFNDL